MQCEACKGRFPSIPDVSVHVTKGVGMQGISNLIADIDAQIKLLERVWSALADLGSERGPRRSRRGKRRMSAAGRARIAAAQRARWSKVRRARKAA